MTIWTNHPILISVLVILALQVIGVFWFHRMMAPRRDERENLYPFPSGSLRYDERNSILGKHPERVS